MHFTLASTPTIIFGVHKIKLLPELISGYGKKALLVTGKSSFLNKVPATELFRELKNLNIEIKVVTISGEPSPKQIDDAVFQHKEWNPDVVAAIGGGSVMDAGKAISAMLCEEENIVQFLEGVGSKIPSGRKVPMIALPTTSGTGSEATKNAVITQQGKNGFKKSLRHNNYIPNIALVDPQLTVNCPASVTAASGMDAFTQLLESYLSTNASPITNALALDGLDKLIRSIETAVHQGNNLEARSDMSYAALISGITIANAGLGVVHGFAQPLGSLFSVPHGIVCGTLMGAANRITVQRIREQNNCDVLEKYFSVAKLVTSNENQTEAINELIEYLDYLTTLFQLPLLSDFGITKTDFPKIVENTSIKEHPVKLTNNDLFHILYQRIKPD